MVVGGLRSKKEWMMIWIAERLEVGRVGIGSTPKKGDSGCQICLDLMLLRVSLLYTLLELQRSIIEKIPCFLLVVHWYLCLYVIGWNPRSNQDIKSSNIISTR